MQRLSSGSPSIRHAREPESSAGQRFRWPTCGSDSEQRRRNGQRHCPVRAGARAEPVRESSMENRWLGVPCASCARSVCDCRNRRIGKATRSPFCPGRCRWIARGPVETLHAISKRTETMKKSGAVGLMGLAAKWLATVPPPIQAVFWRNITGFHPAVSAVQHDLHQCAGLFRAPLCRGKADACGLPAGADRL